MTDIYIPRHFTLQEVLPPEIYKAPYQAVGGKLWLMFDQRILIAADQVRERYGKMICNTWHGGGRFRYRGYRPADCGVGSRLSQHRFGRAIDLAPVGLSAEEIRADLKKHPIPGITRIENGTSWLHIDCANIVYDGIYFFNP
jgi:hypothetical protein